MEEFTFGVASEKETQKVEQLLEIDKSVVETIPLTQSQTSAIYELKEKIDIHDTLGVMNYGAKEQTRLSKFSDQTLAKVKSSQLSDVGKVINELVMALESFKPHVDTSFVNKIFKREKHKDDRMMIQFEEVNATISKIVNILESHYVTLTNDIINLEKMSEENELFYQKLSVYVEAGKLKIAELHTTMLPHLQQKAQSMNQEDLNSVSDFKDALNHFEKKVHDLDITKMISLQMATQIHIIVNANKAMAYKIQSIMKNTIPLWKQQMVIALSAQHTLSAIEADNAIADITSNLFRKNADKVRHMATHTAKASQRSIVDIDTLKEVNTQTISALEEIQNIRQKSEANRLYAQDELFKMRTELANALIDTTK